MVYQMGNTNNKKKYTSKNAQNIKSRSNFTPAKGQRGNSNGA